MPSPPQVIAGSARYSFSSGRTVTQPAADSSRARANVAAATRTRLEKDGEASTELLLSDVAVSFEQHIAACLESQGESVAEADAQTDTRGQASHAAGLEQES